MAKITQLFSKQISELHKKLEDLLENSELNEEIKARTFNHAFEAERDLTQVDSLGFALSNETEARTLMIFNRLSIYFDSGLLFKKQNTNKNHSSWQATNGFDRGHAFPINVKNQQKNENYRFPELTLVEVRLILSPDIFTQIKNLEMLFNEKSRAFIFKPHPDYIFLVTSTLADPWLKLHLEKIHKEVLLLLVDQF